MPLPPVLPEGLTGPGRRTLIMGVLNVTPDSFSDGGRFARRDDAIAQALRLEAEGAAIVDIGGESTRPGHAPVSAAQEIARVVPVIEAIAPRLAVAVSIDTYKAETARAALAAGARIVNDVWGLQRDPAIAEVAAEFGAPVVVMHNREAPDPSADVIDEFRRFFDISIGIARRAGIPDGHIILDPGIGFGKTPAQQIDALRRLPELCAFGFPVLVGASRKSILGRIADRETRPDERLHSSIAAHVLAASLGAAIVRVHDVGPHREALRVIDAVMHGSTALREPA
ncbi:dihydropteroate synthase [Enterovirga rhinocerotis]|nr:dihydropteroate synthase [Enterovirga rhinocerotis]